MASVNFVMPFRPAFDSNATPISGAKAYFYLTGTTTPAAIWTDEAMTVAATNPLVANAAGRFDQTFLDDSITYRVRITDPEGALVEEYDPYSPTLTATIDDLAQDYLAQTLTAKGAAEAAELSAERYAAALATSTTYGSTDEGIAATGDGDSFWVRVGGPVTAALYYNDDGTAEFVGNLTADALVLTPYMFGAVGDGVADDAAAIQAMFDFVTGNNAARPISFAGGHFWLGDDIGDGLTLPIVTGLQSCIVIDGDGATLELGPTNATLFKRMAADADEANTLISAGTMVIKNITMIGEAADGQIAMDISCIYGARFENIHILGFDYGFIGTWLLNSLWMNVRFTNPVIRSMVVQSGGTDFRTGLPRWTGGSNSFHASNVLTLINCRVYGAATQTHAFSFYQADSLRVINCISEGNSTGIDFEFDYQGSTNVRNFDIDGFHCEAPNAKLNLRIRHSGLARIKGLRRSFATPLCDASGSQTGLSIIFEGLISMGNLPSSPGPAINPNGRWFFHSDGGGIGGTEAGNSVQTEWLFTNCNIAAKTLLSNPAVWEHGALPQSLRVIGFESGSTGIQDYCTTARTITASQVLFEGAVKFNTDDTWRFGQSGRPIAIYGGSEGIYFKDNSQIKRCGAGYATVAANFTVNAGSSASFDFALGTTVTSGLSNTLLVQPSDGATTLLTIPLGILASIPTTTTGRITLYNPTGSNILIPAGTVFRFNLIGHAAI